MNITKPIIRKIKDNETALAEFEKEIKTNEAEDTKDIIMNFPTVYIHNWRGHNRKVSFNNKLICIFCLFFSCCLLSVFCYLFSLKYFLTTSNPPLGTQNVSLQYLHSS